MIVTCSLDEDEPRLRVYRQLKQTNLTRWSGQFIAEGDKVVDRLLASGLEVQSVLVARRWLETYVTKVPAQVPLLVIADDELPQLVGFEFHRGVLACGVRPATPDLAAIVPKETSPWTVVVCPNVQGPDNLGNILRTSAALGVDAVLLGRESADPFSRRVLRVSMGELLRLPIRQSSDLLDDLRTLREVHGVELVATVLDDQSEPLHRYRPRANRLGVLFGGEGNGLTDDVLQVCDRRVSIPMQRGADSLNVATCAGIVLYELAVCARQGQDAHRLS
ncbi:MAG: RNA methyltransferase [Planctomycetaceae bacterium]|nr:RNA methyltransferase [Planctomycetaceae bacterium]